MSVFRSGLTAAVVATAVAAVACAPRGDRADRNPLEQGRTYTAWLYQSQYQKLWDRFSPEMRQSFGSVSDLANFASRAVRRLGDENGRVEERVADGVADGYAASDPVSIYTRTAAFRGAPDRVLIQWSLARDGQVTGLVVRPAPKD
jgi:hypothetical protein